MLGVKVPPKCNEKDNFHKALPNVKKAYVALRKFTPDLKIFYTDISAISVTLCNSEWTQAYMQKTCDVAEKAILAKKNLRKKCVNCDKM